MSRLPRRCRECPKRDENGVCVVHAQWVSAFHPSCPYGRRMMTFTIEELFGCPVYQFFVKYDGPIYCDKHMKEMGWKVK